uniref:Uncharacterized protein n=1 Tax=Corethron hystrix TaxID=216773 RepID=A0A7S1B5K8_9STRA|mmetsp:Transcript_13843/g.30450  ORF Transcript_13843/g.30450 Transcript_13843/m.30450 type:complete len:159 (+) Transcript_13843:39-515(+)
MDQKKICLSPQEVIPQLPRIKNALPKRPPIRKAKTSPNLEQPFPLNRTATPQTCNLDYGTIRMQQRDRKNMLKNSLHMRQMPNAKQFQVPYHESMSQDLMDRDDHDSESDILYGGYRNHKTSYDFLNTKPTRGSIKMALSAIVEPSGPRSHDSSNISC